MFISKIDCCYTLTRTLLQARRSKLDSKQLDPRQIYLQNQVAHACSSILGRGAWGDAMQASSVVSRRCITIWTFCSVFSECMMQYIRNQQCFSSRIHSVLSSTLRYSPFCATVSRHPEDGHACREPKTCHNDGKCIRHERKLENASSWHGGEEMVKLKRQQYGRARARIHRRRASIIWRHTYFCELGGRAEVKAAGKARVQSYGDREENASCADSMAATLQISCTSG
jgi:hypothetical protein